jgi:CspA family cold shock protein
MQVGKIKWFDDRKGFGFVVHPDGRDVFIHYSVIQGQKGRKTLEENQTVKYTVEEWEKGLRATSVQLVAELSHIE